MKEVSASFLSNEDYKKLVLKLNNSNTDYIHYDVMDGNFVEQKNLTVGELTNLLKLSTKKNDIHLMVSNPSKYIEKLKLFDISYITVHYEIKKLDDVLELIKSYGFKAGLSIKPETDIKNIYQYLDKISMVLIMSVSPGKSGQQFIPSSIEKINQLKEEIKRRNLSVKIEIDGGINENNLQYLDNIDIVVSSSYILSDLNNINIIKES